MFRRREPTNPKAANHFTQMVFDHSKQMAVIPNSDRDHVMNSSRAEHRLRTTNADGKPFAIKAMLGGAPDYHGPIYKPGQSDTTPPPNGGRQGGDATAFGTTPKRRMKGGR